jgi:hypothetical protein
MWDAQRTDDRLDDESIPRLRRYDAGVNERATCQFLSNLLHALSDDFLDGSTLACRPLCRDSGDLGHRGRVDMVGRLRFRGGHCDVYR